MQFDDLALPAVDFGQIIERVIQRNQLTGFLIRQIGGLVQRQGLLPLPPLLGMMIPGMIHQDVAHHPSRKAKKLRSIAPANTPPIDQPQIELVDQGGGLERMIMPFSPHIALGDSAQIMAYEWHQLLKSRRIPVTPRHQKARYLTFTTIH